MKTPAMPLTVSKLTAAYHDRIVLHDVNIELPAGEVMAILGANGAGKSTLIKATLGLVPPLAGETKFFGTTLNKARKQVGYMPQSADVDWDFPTTVYDVVTMGTYGKLGWLKRSGQKEKELVEKAMETVGITDLADRQISQLSGGQKQRTFMARILAQDPDLYIMDEPFAGVDVASEKAIVGALGKLKEAGKTLLIVHHDLSTVKDFCTYVTLLKEGQVISSGPLAEAFTTNNIHRAYGFDQIDLGE
ncbi:metal ABC transporter ATP-binding protein [Gleimia sp. 6138-11-ORH1]|uniref:metal ABC transporter ATP-binding protein n=1 Tax=Gleimia sp. 6138-11-ORH1 TaxID=2973937 RepID=UPI002166D901|nr:metal ABC transporter ATP-binding protein [Gleimia sp. 6138-11-ORH1]MCS4485071.1 metal ABC transporter ATP-binding protein [Gleimia sp. 6138-11-ORH1]